MIYWTIFSRVGIPNIVALGIFLLGNYLYRSGEKAKEQEVLIEQQENYIDTTRRIQDAVKSNRNHSVDAAREWLRQRNSD